MAQFDQKPGPGRPPKGYVPQPALHEARAETKAEREARQKLEREFSEYKGKMEERFKFLFDAQSQAKPAEPAKSQIPAFEADPLGHFKARSEALEAKLEEISKGSTQTRQQWEMQQNQARAIQALQAEEQRFAQSAPDYWDATSHLQNMWIAEGKAAGIPDADIHFMPYEALPGDQDQWFATTDPAKHGEAEAKGAQHAVPDAGVARGDLPAAAQAVRRVRGDRRSAAHNGSRATPLTKLVCDN